MFQNVPVCFGRASYVPAILQQEQMPLHGLCLLYSATLIVPLLVVYILLQCCSCCSVFPMLAQLATGKAALLGSLMSASSGAHARAAAALSCVSCRAVAVSAQSVTGLLLLQRSLSDHAYAEDRT